MEFPLVATKVLELHKGFQELCSNTSPETVRTEFNASQGWFSRFCKRHNIRQLSLQGEQLSADQTSH